MKHFFDPKEGSNEETNETQAAESTKGETQEQEQGSAEESDTEE